jgi:ATP-binding cassette, subfamily C, bacterial exporter for protease/lipase
LALTNGKSYEDDEETLVKGPVTRLLSESRKTFFLALGLTFVTQVLSIAPIVYMMNMFDRVMTSRSVVTLISLTVVLIAAYIFGSSIDWLRRRLLMRFALRLDWEVAADVFDAAFRRFAGNGRVNVQQVMGDLVQLRRFFHSSAFIAALDAPFVILLALASSFLHPWLGAYAVVCAALMIFFAFVKARAVSPLLRKASQASAETNRSVAEVLRHSETAMALGMQSTVRSQWYTRHQADLVVDVNSKEASGLIGSLSGFFNRSFPQLGLGLAVYLAISGEISSGMAIGAMFLIRRTVGPIQAFIDQWPKMVTTRMAVERLDKLLLDDSAWHDRMPLPQPKGHLTVENLSCLTKNGKRSLLTNINFELHPGEVLAIVGASAAGKTTLARHLVGVMAPSSGAVRLDGADLHTWVRSSDVPNLGYVPQDVMLLEGTVAENISRLQEVVPAAVVRAAELVGMHKTILSFPDGYNTVLGSGEFALTGGQKQRLLIARALYKDPSFIVLDEPSSSLDAESEEALLTLIRILRNNDITVVYTTHRTNLISASDKILYLERGHQKQFGPTDQIGAAVIAELTGSNETAGHEQPKPKPKALRGGAATRLPKPRAKPDAPGEEVLP